MIKIFKGYIPTDGKKPTEEYKNRTEFYELSDVEKLQSYGAVLEDEIIQIDLDNYEESEILFKIIKEENINCNVLKTSRGKHFYFNNINQEKRKQGYTTALGFKIDIGLGSQNAVIPIKINGEERVWLQEVDYLDYLPPWLVPLDKKKIDFKKMEEGDGRNQELFNYILRLQSAGLTKEDIKTSIRIINKYILKEPLTDNELDVILRDESFKKECFYIKGKLQYEKLAKYLTLEEHVIKINNQLHIYKDGVYSSDTKDIERVLLKYINNSTSSNRSEVIKYLEILAENKYGQDPYLIALNDSILNIKTKEQLDFSPTHIIKNKIKVNYNPDAYHELMDKTLNKICCNNKDLRLLIEEMIGYTLFKRNELRKCFILTGGGSNGKSTLLDVLKELLGKENIASVSLSELNDRFKTFQLEGKLANIGDDISDKYIDDNSTFKKLVTGETVNVERKGKDPYDFNNYSKLLFSCNTLPRINDLSDGLKTRLLFVPFNARFSKNDPDYDPWIKDKLLTNKGMEYLLKIALQGLDRIISAKSFTRVQVVEDAWNEYEKINNPIVEFIEENKIENELCTDVFRKYQVWCAENGNKPVGKNKLTTELKKRNYNNEKRIRVDGKQQRCWTSNES